MAKSKEGKKSFHEGSEDIYDKKVKMRTASDVISRLLWDESLPKDFFVVGYLDRFKGLMEKPFVTLDWSDPATVDNYTLALPKHRIQYFKYKNRKVWDKTTRRDFIFGSTGEYINIYDLMKEVDDRENIFCDEFYVNYDSGDDNDNRSALKMKTYDATDRPNFFIAARISNEDTVRNLSRVADNAKEKEPVLSECCIANAEYHITLCILKLESADQLMDVAQAMKKVQALQLCQPSIKLEKLDVFKHRVLYACVKPNEEFCRLRENLVKYLEDYKINITDRYDFVPHVTILKLSRPVQHAMHSKYLDPCVYVAFEEENFGSQDVTRLHLCEMKDARRDDGFYKCATEVDIIQSSPNDIDSDEL